MAYVASLGRAAFLAETCSGRYGRAAVGALPLRSMGLLGEAFSLMKMLLFVKMLMVFHCF